ncbi:hypothetical protein [Spartinivicinus ruber]|uniref:hypothetical protein n=1 Tax=Spartinivicinus ruber TaxID=2683272 RepID=UPI0013D2E038|nr:hypothetical protein [Spartinivicinus ruber]
MKPTICVFTFLYTLPLLSMFSVVQAKALKVFTEDTPPINFADENNNAVGFYFRGEAGFACLTPDTAYHIG